MLDCDVSITAKTLDTPVLFLIFNRLESTKLVFDSIRRAKPPRLYIASDGPRLNVDNELQVVNTVREFVLNNIDWDCEVTTLFRIKNKGCKYAVSEAITWFFEKEEQGIILEDDCLPSLSFFWFCESLLNKYKNDKRICHIGGTNPIDLNLESDEYYYSEYNRIWGWATWKRAWDKYDVEIKDWPEIKETKLLENILGDSQAQKYKNIFDEVYNNEIDTWDYQWFLIRMTIGKAIIPKVNLITNIGFGNGATHTFDIENRLANLARGEVRFPLKKPKYFIIDYKRDQLWENFSNVKYVFYNKIRMLISRLF